MQEVFQDDEADSDLEEGVSEQEDVMEENSDYYPSDEDDSALDSSERP